MIAGTCMRVLTRINYFNPPSSPNPIKQQIVVDDRWFVLRFCRNIRAQNESSRLWNLNFVTLWNYWKLYEMWRVNPCRPVVQVRLKHSSVEYCLINTNIKNVSTDALHLSAALIKYLWWENEIIFRNDWTNKHIATIIDSSPKQVKKSSNHPISRHRLYKRSRP